MLSGKMDFEDKVDKYSTQRRSYDFKANKKGKPKLIIALSYSWEDNSGNVHSSVKVGSSQKLEVNNWYGEVGEKSAFLIIGAILTLLSGLISSIATLRFKTRLEKEKIEEEERKSKKEDEKRVISVLLSILHTNKKLIKQKSLTIRGWDDIYYKEGFYSTLYRVSGLIKECDLVSIISDLYILISDYDKRLKENEQLITGKIQKDLLDKIDIATESLEGLLGTS